MKLSPEQLLDTVHGALYSSIDEMGRCPFTVLMSIKCRC